MLESILITLLVLALFTIISFSVVFILALIFGSWVGFIATIKTWIDSK